METGALLNRAAKIIFALRFPLLALMALVTIFLGYNAGRLDVSTDFLHMIPQGHEYILDYAPFKQFFGGGNHIRLSVSRKKDTILNAAFLRNLRRITEDVMFIKGVDRLTVRSLVSPDTRFVLEDEEGFVNLVIWPQYFERHRTLLRTCRMLAVKGTVQVSDGVVNVLATHFTNLLVDEQITGLLGSDQNWEGMRSRDFH